MSVARNPDGDAPLWRRAAFEAKSALKRRLASRGTPVGAPDSPYLVVPILGQSNAFGMGRGLDRDGWDRPHPRVHQYAMSGPSKGAVILAEEPLMHEIPGYGVGFGMTFAKLLAEETGRHVLLIPGARGDTSFAPKNGYTWDPADTTTRVNLYANGVRAIDAVLRSQPGSTVAAVLWHQGESDVPLTSGSVYQDKLDSVIDDLRGRYGNDLPFILGQMVPEEMERSRKDYSVIDAIHAETPHRRHRTQFVTGERGCINGGDDRHYNATGQRAMGQGMWASYRQLCPDDLAEYARG
jgi:hypothetical protein